MIEQKPDIESQDPAPREVKSATDLGINDRLLDLYLERQGVSKSKARYDEINEELRQLLVATSQNQKPEDLGASPEDRKEMELTYIQTGLVPNVTVAGKGYELVVIAKEGTRKGLDVQKLIAAGVGVDQIEKGYKVTHHPELEVKVIKKPEGAPGGRQRKGKKEGQ